MILNRVNWKVSLTTAYDLMTSLLESFIDTSELKVSYGDVQETASEWIGYSLNEYQIYQSYDQCTIALAAVLNAFHSAGLVKSTASVKSFMELADIDSSVVSNCMDSMFIEIYRNINEPQKSLEECTTTSNSEEKDIFGDELINKKRRRVSKRDAAKQTKLPQFIKQIKKSSKCGRKHFK
jgi:hypothetical protein